MESNNHYGCPNCSNGEEITGLDWYDRREPVKRWVFMGYDINYCPFCGESLPKNNEDYV